MDKYICMCFSKSVLDKVRRSELVLIKTGDGYYKVEKNKWGEDNRERYKFDPKLQKYIDDSRRVLVLTKRGEVLLDADTNELDVTITIGGGKENAN